jgi:hypothetical protein
MAKTFEQQFESSEFANDADFLKSFDKMISDNPHRHPSDLLFVAESIWRMQLRCVAALSQLKRDTVIEERKRIFEIVVAAFGGDIKQAPHDLQVALSLAIDGDMSAAESARALSAYIVNPPGVHQ